MLWSILIASHAHRTEQLRRLAGILAPQLTDDVEVVVLWNRGGGVLGEYRDALVADARGEYVCFIDDDDRVPDYYVAVIREALALRPEYVGFNVAFTDNSERPLSHLFVTGKTYKAIHSIRYPKWHQKGTTFYRNVSHLNPILTEIARKGSFVGDYSEDVAWSEQVRHLVTHEVFVDRTLYFYDFCQQTSIRSGLRYEHGTRPELPFRFHPDSEV